MVRAFVAMLMGALVAGCGGMAVIDGGDGGASSSSSSSTSSSSTSTTASTTTGGGGCVAVEVAMLCVRGQPDPSGSEHLSPDTPVRFELTPAGCWSSSCTRVHEASCALVAQEGPQLFLDGAFCLEDISAQQGACDPDCGGGGTASCDVGVLPDGGYSASLGALTVALHHAHDDAAGRHLRRLALAGAWSLQPVHVD